MGSPSGVSFTELSHILHLYSIFWESEYLVAIDSKSDDGYSTEDGFEEGKTDTTRPQRIGSALGAFISPLEFIDSIAATLVRDESDVFAISTFVGGLENGTEDNSPFVLCIAKDGATPPSQEVTQYLQETWSKLRSISKVDSSKGRATSATHAVFQDSQQYKSLWEELYRHIFGWCCPKLYSTIKQDCALAKRFNGVMRGCLRRTAESGKITIDLSQRNALQKVVDLIDDVVHIIENNTPGTPELNRILGGQLFLALLKCDSSWRRVITESLENWQRAYEDEIQMKHGDMVFQCKDFMEKLFALFYNVHTAVCYAAYGDASMFDKRLEVLVVDACTPASTLPVVTRAMIANAVRDFVSEDEIEGVIPYTEEEEKQHHLPFEPPSLPVYPHCESVLAAYITTLKVNPTMSDMIIGTSRPSGVCSSCRWYILGVCDYLKNNEDIEASITCTQSSETPRWWTTPGIVSGDRKEKLEECARESVVPEFAHLIRRVAIRLAESPFSWLK